jgi:hypothetical protein
MSRGRPKLEPTEPINTKYTRKFKGEDCDTTWYYDTSITTAGPVRVDVKWHKTLKQMNDEMKAEKAAKKVKSNNNKFFKAKEEQNAIGSSSNKTRGRSRKSI